MRIIVHACRTAPAARNLFEDCRVEGARWEMQRTVVNDEEKHYFAAVETLDQCYAFAGMHLSEVIWHFRPSERVKAWLEARIRHVASAP